MSLVRTFVLKSKVHSRYVNPFHTILQTPTNICLVPSNRGIKRFVWPTKALLKSKKERYEFKNGPMKKNPRNTFIEWNFDSELYAFGKRLGEDFNKDFLQQAFIERSYIIMEEEKQKSVGIDEPLLGLKDNIEFAEKGEYLIEDYVKRYLRTVYPRYPEEGICSVCDYLMSDEVLGDISKHIGTSDIILTTDYPPSAKILANVLKAVVHALELSSGEDRANMFIRDFIITYLSGKDINEIWNITNPEMTLTSILNKDGRSAPEPRLIGEIGRTTILAAYQVGLYCDKELIGVGFGESISVAKEIAALDALKNMFQTNERAKPISFNLMLPTDNKTPFANVSLQDWCEKTVSKFVNKS